MNSRANRRQAMMLGVTSAAVAVGNIRNVSAQDASPEAHEHEVNPARAIPEITVTVTDAALEFPAEVVAGINRVTFENASSGEGHILTIRLPDDVDMEDLMAVMADETAPMPEYLRDQYYPGIPDYPAIGGSNTGYIEYMPGTYMAFNIFGMQAPALFSAIGNPWGVVPPQSDHQVGMVEMAFLGLEGQIPAGAQVWSLVNFGATWHEIMVIGMPAMMTPDELLEFFMTTSGEDDLENAGYFQVGASGIISPGVQIWLEFDLAPGAYGAFCFAPDDFAGPPHALSGMVSTFEVI